MAMTRAQRALCRVVQWPPRGGALKAGQLAAACRSRPGLYLVCVVNTMPGHPVSSGSVFTMHVCSL